MKLRPYQMAAVEAVEACLATHRSCLIVLPTGTGKTVVAGHLAHRVNGRVLMLAHREELIRQAAAKLGQIIGQVPDIEQASQRADAGMWGKTKAVVASVQTMIAGSPKRMTRFDPCEFGLIIIDEAHHAPANSYRMILNYFTQANPNVKIVGVTATPDRADKMAIGSVFDVVAYDYELPEAIGDGWLVPVKQTCVSVLDLDYSHVGITAGDLNQRGIAAAQRNESTLQGFADSIVRLCGAKRTIVFATPGSVKSQSEGEDEFHIAERLTLLLNDRVHGRARRVHQGTHPEERRQIIEEFRAGQIQYLVNVGIFTEGFDDPGVEAVAITCPTTSRAKYAQMVGRGTRPLPGLIDQHGDPAARVEAIASSPKPELLVVDFAGNAGKHKLVGLADILGGKMPPEVVDRVREQTKGKDSVDVQAELRRAKKQIDDEKEAEEEERRQRSLARAVYETREIDPFGRGGDAGPRRVTGWVKGQSPTEKQIAFLKRNGIAVTAELTKAQASAIISKVVTRLPKSVQETMAARWKQSQSPKRYPPRPPMRIR